MCIKKRIEILPDVWINPRVIETARGPVEFDITEGEHPVVLGSHGGLGGVDQARIILNWLDQGEYRLLSPSRPGYLNTPLESGRTVEEQADLFAALLDALCIEKAAVVSFSAGGPPAYTFAVRHPDRVWALLAISSISGYYEMPEKAGPMTQVIFMTNLGQGIIKKIADVKPDIFLKAFFQAEAYFTRKQIKEHVDRVLNTPEMIDLVKSFISSINPYDAKKRGTENDLTQYLKLAHLPLEQVTCPSLIIHGTHDADVKFHEGVFAKEHIPNCERYWIEGGAHSGFWLHRHAKKIQQAARNFLSRHRPDG